MLDATGLVPRRKNVGPPTGRASIGCFLMSTIIDKLHDKARRAVQAGEHKFRQAAEYLAEARKLGATQRQSAKAIGKSPAWVNALLKWKAAGYKDTPFGP
jgi:hypothetical protein